MATPSQRQDQTMSIKGVTLFDNGYAVFQREAIIQGHGSIDLYFSPGHMNSVLETLQFLGEGGRKVGNIAYEATKPKPSVELSNNNPLLNLLGSLMGRLIILKYKDGESECKEVEGKLLGVDKWQATGCDAEVLHVSVLIDGSCMLSIPLASILSFRILESQVQQDIAFSLDLRHTSSESNLQKLSVFYNNVEDPVTLIARYGFRVTEWKSSYRMKLSDHPTQFKLDGLAIVENSLDEDWNDVKLTLVVGAPTIESSRSMTDEGQWKLNIKTLDGSFTSVRANPKDTVVSIKLKLVKKLKVPFLSFRLMFAGKPIEEGRLLSDYTVNNNATLHMNKIFGSKSKHEATATEQPFVLAAQDNLSYYEIPMRVTAKRKQKAIVPLLQAELEGQKVVLYDETIRKGNPLQALLFENITGGTLDSGTLQISTDDNFLGQGNLPTLHPGDESPPIPYAVELNCEVAKSGDSTYLKPHQVTIEGGTMKILRIHRVLSLYRMKNKGKSELDFLLNHLFLEDYDLVQKPDVEEEEPVDITDRFYQFRFVLPPMIEKKTFVVREEINDLKEFDLSSEVDDALLKEWVHKQLISADVEKRITQILNTKKEISRLERNLHDKTSEIGEITSTQTRLQNIISSLEGHEKEAAKYIKSLSHEEDKLKALKGEIKVGREKKKELSASLIAQANAVNFSKEFPRSGSDD
jgi:hypothetical protein